MMVIGLMGFVLNKIEGDLLTMWFAFGFFIVCMIVLLFKSAFEEKR